MANYYLVQAGWPHALGPDSSCVVFLGKPLSSNSVQMGTSKFKYWG